MKTRTRTHTQTHRAFCLGPRFQHPAPNHPPKYNPTLSKFGSSVIPTNLSTDTKKLIHASLSLSSWKKHESAMNCFQKFDDSNPSCHPWPLSGASISEFVTWAAVTQKLKAQTIKSYLSSLKFVHKLNNLPCENCSGFIPDTILKGIENLEFYSSISKESRKAMSLPLLKLLGHEIARADWTTVNKAVVWSACTIAFFGSLRMGEILAKSPDSFNPGENLLWSDLSFKKDSILLHVKIPKNKTKKGEFVDIFEFVGHNCCFGHKKLEKAKGAKWAGQHSCVLPRKW